MTPSPESPAPAPARSQAVAEAAGVTANEAWGAVSRMIAGMIVYGALGWWLGGVFERTALGLGIGLLVGLGLGLYLSLASLSRLSESAPALEVSSSRSWSARMTRARMERAREEPIVG